MHDKGRGGERFQKPDEAPRRAARERRRAWALRDGRHGAEIGRAGVERPRWKLQTRALARPKSGCCNSSQGELHAPRGWIGSLFNTSSRWAS
jgi:hypothetical protein